MIPKSFLLKILTLKEHIREKTPIVIEVRRNQYAPSLLIQDQE
jgi:hypothetical protein